MKSIKHLIVPYKRHSLKECDEIIRVASGMKWEYRAGKLTSDDPAQLIDECLDSSKLNSWERDFIISINDQFTMKGFLSEKQMEILEKIYNKI